MVDETNEIMRITKTSQIKILLAGGISSFGVINKRNYVFHSKLRKIHFSFIPFVFSK